MKIESSAGNGGRLLSSPHVRPSHCSLTAGVAAAGDAVNAVADEEECNFASSLF